MGNCSSQSSPAASSDNKPESKPNEQKKLDAPTSTASHEPTSTDGEGVSGLKRQITEKDNQIKRLLALLEKHHLDANADPQSAVERPKPAGLNQAKKDGQVTKTVSFRSESKPTAASSDAEGSGSEPDSPAPTKKKKKVSVSVSRQQRTFTSDAVMPSRKKTPLRHRIAIATRHRSKTERGANMPDGEDNRQAEPQIKTTIKKLMLIGQTLGKMKRQITKFKANDLDGVLSLPRPRSVKPSDDTEEDDFDFSVSSDFLDADGDGVVDDVDAGRAGVELHEFELSNKAQEVMLRNTRDHTDTFEGAFGDPEIQSLFDTTDNDLLFNNSLLQLEYLMYNTEASLSAPDVFAFERRITRIVRATRTVMSELEAFEDDDEDDYDMDEDALADAAEQIA